jgi:hypothetical protein
MYSVNDLHLGEVKRAQPLQAGNVDAILLRIRSPLMMGVDPALRAEIVLGRVRVELIKRQQIFAGQDRDVSKIGRYRNGATHTADRAIATARGIQAVSQTDMKAHRATVACTVDFLDVFVHIRDSPGARLEIDRNPACPTLAAHDPDRISSD